MHIDKYKGKPQDSGRPGELTRWQRFLSLIRPELSRHYALLDRYAKSEVLLSESEVKKRALEAAEIAADIQRKNLENTKQYFDLLDAVVSDEDDAELSKQLKLAKLFEAHPELEGQLQKVKNLMNAIENEHGGAIETDSPKN